MNRIVYTKIAGKNYPMSFSLGAAKKIAEKFGSTQKAMDKMKKAGGNEIDILIDMLALLISQGCAYKNYFEADIPAPDDAPLIDGKWTPLPREVIEIAIDVTEVEEIVDKISECINTGSKKEVEAKQTGKNAEAAQV